MRLARDATTALWIARKLRACEYYNEVLHISSNNWVGGLMMHRQIWPWSSCRGSYGAVVALQPFASA